MPEDIGVRYLRIGWSVFVPSFGERSREALHQGSAERPDITGRCVASIRDFRRYVRVCSSSKAIPLSGFHHVIARQLNHFIDGNYVGRLHMCVNEAFLVQILKSLRAIQEQFAAFDLRPGSAPAGHS